MKITEGIPEVTHHTEIVPEGIPEVIHHTEIIPEGIPEVFQHMKTITEGISEVMIICHMHVSFVINLDILRKIVIIKETSSVMIKSNKGIQRACLIKDPN